MVEHDMANGIDAKVKPVGALADIVGSKPLSRGQSTKKMWKYIDKRGLKGEKGDGHTITYKSKKTGKTLKATGGQIIHCGDDPVLKEFCDGKKMVPMTALGGFVNNWIE
jgi:chromatin remodeling complex protein RSC6